MPLVHRSLTFISHLIFAWFVFQVRHDIWHGTTAKYRLEFVVKFHGNSKGRVAYIDNIDLINLRCNLTIYNGGNLKNIFLKVICYILQ